MPTAQRFRRARRALLSAVAAVAVACGPRVATLPLDSDPAPPPRPAPVVARAETAPPPAPHSFSEEDLPEMPAAPPPTPTGTPSEPPIATAAPDGSPAAPPAGAATRALDPALPSPLDTIRPGMPPNVAAATRLADAARVRLAAGDDAGALERLERAIAIDPTNTYAYYFLAQLHFRTRSYDQAIAFADRAAALSTATSPEWASRAWVLAGAAYEAAGRFADARQAYLRAVRALPGNPTALAGLARIGGGTP